MVEKYKRLVQFAKLNLLEGRIYKREHVCNMLRTLKLNTTGN